MCVLPFFHSFGLVAMNFGILRAAKLVLLPRFELNMALKGIEQGEADVLPGRAATVRRAQRGAGDREVRPGVVKACISGAAPLPRAVAEKFDR